MTENNTPGTPPSPDWTPGNDTHPTEEVIVRSSDPSAAADPGTDPAPVPPEAVTTEDDSKRPRWLVPAGIAAGALVLGLLGGVAGATIASDADDHHGPEFGIGRPDGDFHGPGDIDADDHFYGGGETDDD